MIKQKFILLIALFTIFQYPLLANSQADSTFVAKDTLIETPLEFTPESASDYLSRLIGIKQLWKHSDDSLKKSLYQLINHYQNPYDSAREQLMDFDFTAVDFDTTYILSSDTLPLRWLGKSLFMIDTLPLQKSPAIFQKTIIYNNVQVDSSFQQLMDSIPMVKKMMDSLIAAKDTLIETLIDFAYLESKNIQLYEIIDGTIVPPVLPITSPKTLRFAKDSSQLILSEYLRVLKAGSQTPFNILPGSNFTDSLQQAVETLLLHHWERDSMQVFLSGMEGEKTPFWLSTHKPDLLRYWIKNTKNDSITIWLGNPSKFQLSMMLEESVHVERMGKMPADDLRFTTTLPRTTLLPVNPLKEIPVLWDFGFKGAFSLNQNYITYWAQGGESSFAGMLDLSGKAKYTNKDTKGEWLSTGRLRYGNVWTKDKGARVNTDILEINSQYNKIIAGKLDFSSVFYFKTQVSKGYNYPNDSVAVSKFLNPGTFTIGIGAEYSPFEKMVINFSPLSYKGTFVLDTANIDQTIHGIDKDARSKQEIGGQLLIKNNFTFLDEVQMANTLRLFSSYANNPQNVDVDWEMTIERRISWIFSVKLNVHLIYDDDVRFPIESPEGVEYKAPRTQFNQFLGLSVSLNL